MGLNLDKQKQASTSQGAKPKKGGKTKKGAVSVSLYDLLDAEDYKQPTKKFCTNGTPPIPAIAASTLIAAMASCLETKEGLQDLGRLLVCLLDGVSSQTTISLSVSNQSLSGLLQQCEEVEKFQAVSDFYRMITYMRLACHIDRV